MPENQEFTRFTIIDAVFVQNVYGGGSYVTVWAKSPNFGNSVGIEYAPTAESIEQATAISSRPFITHQFVEFQNPDWSETIHSPANNGQITMIAPKNYERAGFLWPDSE
mgnify:FL=1